MALKQARELNLPMWLPFCYSVIQTHEIKRRCLDLTTDPLAVFCASHHWGTMSEGVGIHEEISLK